MPQTKGKRAQAHAGARAAVHVSGKNRLLALLTESERTRVLRSMEHLSVEHRDYVFVRREPIEFVDFPLSAMVSVVTVMANGDSAEVGTVGNEGMSGTALMLGAADDTNDAFYQVPGEILRMPVAAFMVELRRRGNFEKVMRRYARAFHAQVGQSAACNVLHGVDQRLCRWILMSHDRIGHTPIKLTQEFVAEMLGVTRPTVSIVAGTLQKAGLIRYKRGVIDVLDRQGLERASCECYAVIADEFRRLLTAA